MMTDRGRLLLFEQVLEDIAAWKDGPDLSRTDEPAATAKAREAILKQWPEGFVREGYRAFRFRGD